MIINKIIINILDINIIYKLMLMIFVSVVG